MPTANPTKFFEKAEHGWAQWYVSHPAMPWPIRLELKEPDRITLLDSISFETGRVRSGGKSVDEMQAALASRFALGERQAENVVEGWLCRSAGWLVSLMDRPPTFVVEPIFNPDSHA